jgi:hypothetical protein
LGARLSEVEVPEAIVETLAKAPQIASKLLMPEVDQMLRIDLDCLDLADFFLRDDDATDRDGVDAFHAALPRRPTVADELGSQVPLFGPVAVEATGGLFVPDDGTALILPKKVGASDIDKRVSGRMSREIHPVERYRERELKSRFAIHKIRLDVIRLGWVGVNVIFDSCPHSIESLRGFLERSEVSPKRSKDSVSSRQGAGRRESVDPDEFVKGFKSSGEGTPCVEVDGDRSGSEAMAKLPIEFLRARAETA